MIPRTVDPDRSRTLSALVSRSRDFLASMAPAVPVPIFELAGARVALLSARLSPPAWAGRYFGDFVHCELSRADGDIRLAVGGDESLARSLRRAMEPGEITFIPPETYIAAELVDGVGISVYVMCRDVRSVLLVPAGGRGERMLNTMRTVRTLLRLRLHEMGWSPLHSAACSLDGVAACIVGPKRAGKTATLLNLARLRGAQFISNDKTLIRDSGSQVWVCGLPFRVSVRQDVRASYPELSGRRGDAGQALLMPAPTFARRMGVTMRPTAPLHLCIIPHFDPDLLTPKVTVDPLDPAIILSHRLLLSDFDQGFLNSLFDIDEHKLDAQLQRAAQAAARTVTMVSIAQSGSTSRLVRQAVQQLIDVRNGMPEASALANQTGER